MGRKRQRKKEEARKNAAVRQLEERFLRDDDDGFLELFRRSFPTPKEAAAYPDLRELHDAVLTRSLSRALAAGELDALARLRRHGAEPARSSLARLATAVVEASAGRYRAARTHLAELVASEDPSLPGDLLTKLAAFLDDSLDDGDDEMARAELPAELRDAVHLRNHAPTDLESPAGQAIAAFGKAMAALRHRDFRPGARRLAKAHRTLREVRSYLSGDEALDDSFATIDERLSLLERLLELERAVSKACAAGGSSRPAALVSLELMSIGPELTAALRDDAERALDAPLQEALRRRWRSLLEMMIAHDTVSLATIYTSWPELCVSTLEPSVDGDADPCSAMRLWARAQSFLADDDLHELALLLAGQAKDETTAHRLAVLWELEMQARLHAAEPDLELDRPPASNDESLRRLARMARQISERFSAKDAGPVARNLREHFLDICREEPISTDAWRAAEQLLVYLPQDFELLVIVLIGALGEMQVKVVEQIRTRLGELGVVESFDRELMMGLFDEAIELPGDGLTKTLEAVRPCLGEEDRQGLEGFIVRRLAKMTEYVVSEINLHLASDEPDIAEFHITEFHSELKAYIASLGSHPGLVAQMVCVRCFRDNGQNAVKILRTFFAETKDPEAALVAFEIFLGAGVDAPAPIGIQEALKIAATTALKRLDRNDWHRWLPLFPALFIHSDSLHRFKPFAYLEALSRDTSLNEAEYEMLSVALEALKSLVSSPDPDLDLNLDLTDLDDLDDLDANAPRQRRRRRKSREPKDDPQLSFDF